MLHKKSVKVNKKGIVEKSEKITPRGLAGRILSVSKSKKRKNRKRKGGEHYAYADALVAPAVAATMYVCSGGAAGFSVKKVRLESDPKKIQ